MVWAVDKKVVRHVLECGGQLVEIPVRVSFEYQIEDGALVPDTLTLKVLYNKRAVLKRFSGLGGDAIDAAVRATADREIREHLAMSGVQNVPPI